MPGRHHRYPQPVTGAVIDLAGSIDPDPTGAATGARSGALARRGCRRGRCSKGAGRCRGRTPRLHAAMTPAGAETFRAGEGCTVLAGGGDRVRVLRVNRAHGQEEPRDQGEGQQRFAHQIPLLMNDARPQYQPWGMLCAIDLCLARAVRRLVSVARVRRSSPDPQPCGREDIIQVIERGGDEAGMKHSSV